MRNQATRIEPPQPANSTSEKAGCLVALLLFIGAVASAYVSPWIVDWLFRLVVA